MVRSGERWGDEMRRNQEIDSEWLRRNGSNSEIQGERRVRREKEREEKKYWKQAKEVDSDGGKRNIKKNRRIISTEEGLNVLLNIYCPMKITKVKHSVTDRNP